MENLFEELNDLADKHNKKLDHRTIEKLISYLEFTDSIFKFANELKDDPNSMFNSIDEEIEDILLSNQENYLKAIKILNNIYNEKESIQFWKHCTFIYDIINAVFLKARFSKGLSHFYSLIITKNLLADMASEIICKLTIDNLSSVSDFELDSLKLKNKLVFSLVELTTNKRFTSSGVNNYFESIELSKQIKSLSDKPATNISNSNFIDTTQKDNKFETLKSNLYNNGFYELSKVKSLSQDGQSKLIDLLVLNE